MVFHSRGELHQTCLSISSIHHHHGGGTWKPTKQAQQWGDDITLINHGQAQLRDEMISSCNLTFLTCSPLLHPLAWRKRPYFLYKAFSIAADAKTQSGKEKIMRSQYTKNGKFPFGKVLACFTLFIFFIFFPPWTLWEAYNVAYIHTNSLTSLRMPISPFL